MVEATRHGVQRFVATVLPENRAMNSLMHAIAPDAKVNLADGVESYDVSLDRLDARALCKNLDDGRLERD